ncbi:MAG: alpha/beta hydrolase [Pseudomonadota bacterium]
MTAIEPKERTFTINGFHYAAQEWGDPGGFPILALHGWLDNCGSFSILAQQLPDAHIVAVDLSGHGRSSHRQGLSDYSVWGDIAELFAIADQMGWQCFAFMGHSRGAMVSVLASGVFPQRVSHTILIDAIVPVVMDASKAPERMATSIEEMQRRVRREQSCYPTYQAAINARCHSEFGSITQATAEILAQRGLVKRDAGYHWHADGKLWAPSTIALTAEQLSAFLDKISAKVLVLVGDRGFKQRANQSQSPFYIDIDATIKRLRASLQEFDDGHYLHMEACSTEVADCISRFIAC